MRLSEFTARYREVFTTPESFNAHNLRNLKLDDAVLKRSFSLTPYQIPAAWALSHFPSLLLTDKPGLGKTPTTIAALADLWKAGAKRTLIVVLSSIVHQWAEQIKLFSTFTVSEVTGTLEKRQTIYAKYIKSPSDILLTSYNTFVKDAQFYMALSARGALDIVVFDEADYFKSTDSETLRVVAEVSKPIKHIKLLTGTPSDGKLESMFAFIHVLSHGRNPHYALDKHYCEFNQIKMPVYDKRTGVSHNVTVNTISGYKNVEEFRALFNEYAFGRTPEECGAQYPNIHEIAVNLDRPKQLVAYDNLIMKGVFVEPETKHKQKLNSLQKVSYLHRGAHSLNMLYPDLAYTNEKLESLFKLLDSFGDDQVAIFCQYSFNVDTLLPILTERGGCSLCTGAVRGTKRNESVEKFKTGENKYLLLSLAGYAGLDLPKCRRMVLLDTIYNPAKWAQLKGRICRKTTIETFSDIYLYTVQYAGSIEDAINKMLEAKSKKMDYFETDEETARGLLEDVKKRNSLLSNMKK